MISTPLTLYISLKLGMGINAEVKTEELSRRRLALTVCMPLSLQDEKRHLNKINKLTRKRQTDLIWNLAWITFS